VTALERWARELASWVIPQDILARAPESPYGYPSECFRRRADRARAAEPTATTERALEALPEGGSVLDVGVGGGATSLPLAPKASRIVGVDASEAMLEAFRAAAASAGVEAVTVLGAWPDVAAETGPADVVVCGHVVYNVPELGPFVLALHEHARRRVVLELTQRHPLSWMNDLWRRFHDLERPTGPSADDARAALAELGLAASREDRVVRPTPGGFGRPEDAVALVRRRLCLPPERDAEVREALGDRLFELGGLWSAGPREQTVVTLWWDTA
jgi:2-polyprenyl-3-methyl-5-hydroxy-6-metoxy-1,4-benzoquinol methylase